MISDVFNQNTIAFMQHGSSKCHGLHGRFSVDLDGPRRIDPIQSMDCFGPWNNTCSCMDRWNGWTPWIFLGSEGLNGIRSGRPTASSNGYSQSNVQHFANAFSMNPCRCCEKNACNLQMGQTSFPQIKCELHIPNCYSHFWRLKV